MRNWHLGMVLTLLIAATGPWVNAQQDSGYLVLHAPGANQTIPFGVNNSGDVVGLAEVCVPREQDGLLQWGFFFQHGDYVEIAFPGAVSTVPRAVSERGEVVGYYYGPDLRARAFRYWRGEFETLPVSGTDVLAFGINSGGDIVGSLNEGLAGYRAFLLTKHGELTILEPPAGVDLWNLQALSINNAGTIAGIGQTSFGSAAFLYTRGQFTIIAGMTILGVNERGDVLGTPPGEPYSVYRNGQPLTLNHPAAFSRPLALSNQDVVGLLASVREGECSNTDGYRLRFH